MTALTDIRLPPQNLDAERCVLGSRLLMHRQLMKITSQIAVDNFYSDQHGKLFAAIADMHHRGCRDIDGILLCKELANRGQLAEVGGGAYIAEILESVPHASHVRYDAGIVREKSRMRNLIQLCYETLSCCLRNKFQCGNFATTEKLQRRTPSRHFRKELDIASVNRDSNGLRILFVDWNEQRKQIRLGKGFNKATTEEIGRHIDHLVACVASKGTMNLRTASWLGDIGDKLHEKLFKAGLTDRRTQTGPEPTKPLKAVVELGTFLSEYRADGLTKTGEQAAELTLVKSRAPMDSLIRYFGFDRDIATITHDDPHDYRK